MAENVADKVEDRMQVDEQDTMPDENPTAAEQPSSECTRVMEQLKRTQPRLPISKVKKIAKSDPDYILTAGNAFMAVAFAAELFVQSLTEEMIQLSYLSSKSSNSKSVRLSYQHLSECVARKENYLFLEDVVPKTKNLRTLVKENKVRYMTRPEGQQTLPFREKTVEPEGEEGDEEEQDSAEEDVEDPAVEEQLKEIEEMNRVPDLPGDGNHSEEEQSDHGEEDEPPAN
ncbi:hypothetical protein HG536_0F01930 [Torulaspora globosa]|uniref:Transcription factor CBF/NF-Y/archaeal histone domain-containing protein n=1 Tax=Torulaspora globosa TaxID=48254 RepID=A0A7G3ZK32_9SACH|nr:uncharacterized protein HG536_0F01930 [Torulaspora globosa]QLL33868.1 hypothetical protein HG536_0F01930 [Torulaspora globosa]